MPWWQWLWQRWWQWRERSRVLHTHFDRLTQASRREILAQRQWRRMSHYREEPLIAHLQAMIEAEQRRHHGDG